MSGIVTSGLVLDVDTTDDASWPGGGTLLTNTVSGSTVNLILDDTVTPYSTATDSVTMIYNATGGSQVLKTTAALSIGSVMFWIHRNSQNSDEYLLDVRNDIALSYIILGGGQQLGSYWSTGTHYINGVVSTSLSDIPIGEWASVVVTASSATIESGIIRLLNGNGKNFDAEFGRILIYDKQLTQAEVTQNHTEFVPKISSVVAGAEDATVTVLAITGAIGYQFRHTISGGSEVIAVSDITDLTYTITSLTPASTYTISFYIDTGSGYTFVESIETTTIGNTLVTDGLIHHFNANDPASFVEGDEFMTDLQGSGLTMTSRTGVATTIADGGLDFSLGDNRMRLSTESTFRTFSIWYKKTESLLANPLFVVTGTGSIGYLASRAIGSLGYSGGEFFPTAYVYVDGVLSDIPVGWNDLPDGELHNISFVGSADINAVMTVFSSNSDGYFGKGIIHSFQFYDKVLSEEELLQNFYAGSGALAFTVEPTALSIIVTIIDAGATSYKLTYTPDGGSETVFIASTTDLLHTIDNLQPEVNYTVSLYIDNVFEASQTTTTLAIIPSFEFVQDGAILYFDANDSSSYTEGAEVLTDILGSTNTYYTLSGVTTLLNDGGLDLSAGDNKLQMTQSATFQTISVWYKKTESLFGNPFDIKDSPTGSQSGYIGSRPIGETGGFAGGVFFPTATIYVDGVLSNLLDWNELPDGELHHVVFVGSSSVTGVLTINGSGFYASSELKSVFHSVVLYDKALSESEILENYNAGIGFQSFSTIPRPSSIEVSVTSIENVTYRLTSQETGSDTVRVIRTDFTDTDQVVSGLVPETEYTLRLFYTYINGPGYQLLGSSVVSTVANSAENYDVISFDDGLGGFDVSALDEDSRALFSEIMNELFTTGDEITLSLSSGQFVSATFVNRGGTVSVENASAVVLPFDADAGLLQTANLTLTDTSTEAVDYDETAESITIDSVEYFVGDVLILDGKKVTVSFS